MERKSFVSRKLIFSLKKPPWRRKQDLSVVAALENLDSSPTHLDQNQQVEVYKELLRQCGSAGNLPEGKLVHQHLIRTGHSSNQLLSGLLIQMYGNCGQIHLARAAFESIPAGNRSIISFNQMLSAYISNNLIKQSLELYRKLCSQSHPQPDRITYMIVLGGCSAAGDLPQGREIHTRIKTTRGASTSIPLQNALINMYGKCASPREARGVFDEIGEKDRVSWTSMIATYANNGHCREALELYLAMESEGVEPDRVTYTSALLACQDLSAGRALHERIISRKMESDFVGSSLINMYARCGDLGSARRAFARVGSKHVVCWTALMTAYLRAGLFSEALELYWRMELEGVHPDGVALITALGACGSLGDLQRGEAIHDQVKQSGLGHSIVIQTALLTMYAKCERLERARRVFEGIRLQRRNVHCWTAMISAHAQAGESREALELYDRMIAEGTSPNEYTFSNLLAGCCLAGDLEQGKRIHEHARRGGFDDNLVVRNALVAMYAKCGSLELARAAFESSRRRDLVTWNSMIGAYAQHGCGREALELLGAMEEAEEEIKPDGVTIASSLTACATLGSLRQGVQIHQKMISSLESTSAAVQTALVSLYGKCGRLETARTIFETSRSSCPSSRNDVFLWTAMAEAYAQKGHAPEALELYHEMVLDGLKPNEITATSVLIGCSHGGLLASGVECFQDLQSEHGILPLREHYLCMVDLLGRAGRVADAESLVDSMPFEPDSVAWLTVLGSCRTQVDAGCARRVAGRIQELDPENTSLYSLLSSVFTEAGLKQEAGDVRVDMRVRRGLKKPPGSSSLVQSVEPESSVLVVS